jgi:hypothetical protein
MTPDYKSWLTLHPAVQKVNCEGVWKMIEYEAANQNRRYVLKRLISALLTKQRQQLHKKYKL